MNSGPISEPELVKKCHLAHGQPRALRSIAALAWRAARALAAQQSYTLPEGSVCADGIVTPLSAHLRLRRLAALKSTSRAHVDALPAAAASIAAFSASVSRIGKSTLLRSSGGFCGAPRLAAFFAMPPLSYYKKTRQPYCTGPIICITINTAEENPGRTVIPPGPTENWR